MSQVSCVHVDRYDEELLYRAVKQQFELLGLLSDFHPGIKVLIKPNLIMKRRPDEFTTTHPAVAAGVVRVLQENGVTDIVIADSPGGPYSKALLRGIYDAAGFTELSERYPITLNVDTGYREKENPEGVVCKSFYVIDPVFEADVIIDLCKFKTHGMVGLSGGVKNLFGCVPGLMKPELHFRFPEEKRFCGMLVDLCEAVRPTITIVDAVDAMQGDGPSSGTLLHTGMLLAGRNPYDVDLLLCKAANLNPETVYTVSAAKERGLSAASAEEVEVLGDELRVFSGFVQPTSHGVDFSASLPKWAPKFIVTHFSSRPKVVRKDCIGCGKCAESCPAKVIDIADRKARIRYDKCIRCYCCHEMCPVRVIKIKRSRFFRF